MAHPIAHPFPSHPGVPTIRLRPYRNGDSPALVDLWNRALPRRGVVGPLNVHEFDALVMGRLGFDPAGLILAERDGSPGGWVHAGFGPAEPAGPSQRLDTALGTVAMLLADPDRDDPELESTLLGAAERYLRDRGAQVIYAGGRHPLDPFYWGLYGNSEFAGVLDGHAAFQRALTRAGYEPAARSILFEADLTDPEPRDPKAVLLRRQVRVDVVEDVLPDGWWESLAIGLFRPTAFRLVDRATGRPLAEATTWDIAAGFGVGDGRSCTGLIKLEVPPAERRRGYARFLVGEVLRHARKQLADVVCIQTDAENRPALALYEALGFTAVDASTLFRLPAERMARPDATPPEG